MSTNPYQVEDGQEVDAEFFNGFLGDVDLRLRGLEAQRQDLDAAIQGINDLAVFRLNEVLTPAMQTLFDAQHLGFLNAPVAGDAVLGLGASTMTIAADRRHVFTPSPWVMLVREDNLDDYAGGRVQSYDQQTGELVVDVSFVHGDAGTYGDVSVWGVAGGALSALDSAEKTTEDRAAVAADAAQVALDRAYVESVAADIEDGPVLSVNGANGTVTLGIDDIPDLTTTLAGKSSTSHNHDASYSSLGHNHDASYSSLGHNHDASYSSLGHNHDAAYSALGHTHTSGEVSGLGQAAAKSVSDNSKSSVASISGSTTSGHLAVFADANGTVADGGVQPFDLFLFGHGGDGDVTISSGTTTLTRDMYYNNLTISGTGKIVTAGWRIFVAGTLDLSAAPANAIAYNGNNGTVSPGTELASNSVGGSGAGGSPIGSNGDNGGGGGASNSGAGGTVSTAYVVNRLVVDLLRPLTFTPILGGAGGGTQSGIAGGGSGGGVIAIFAKTINRGASTAAGAISATGGNGYAGGMSGGGGGGWIFIVFKALSGTSATNAINASGGGGGNTGGTGGRITLVATTFGTNTETSGGAPSGTTGGVQQANL